jgi:hypothetical protein
MWVITTRRVLPMKRPPSELSVSPLRRHAADALRRARKLPIGHERNDLRQLGLGLLWLDKRSIDPATLHRLNVVLTDCAPENKNKSF